MATRALVTLLAVVLLAQPLWADGSDSLDRVVAGPWETDRPDLEDALAELAEALGVSVFLYDDELAGQAFRVQSRPGQPLPFEVLKLVLDRQGIGLSIRKGSDGSPSHLVAGLTGVRAAGSSPRAKEDAYLVFQIRPGTLDSLAQSLRARATSLVLRGGPRIRIDVIGDGYLLLSGPPEAVSDFGDWLETTGEPLPVVAQRTRLQNALAAPFELHRGWQLLLVALGCLVAFRGLLTSQRAEEGN